MSHNKRIEEGYDKVIELLEKIKKMVDDLCAYLIYDKNVKKPKQN